MNELYAEPTGENTVVEPLYTAEDAVAPVNTNKDNYSIVKGVAALATGNTEIPKEVNFNTFVDEEWRKTVPENNRLDTETAINAATTGNTSIVEEALATYRARNAIAGAASSDIADVVRVKMRELVETAVENTAIKNPSVLFNNSTSEISNSTSALTSQISAQATLEKAMKDGAKLSTIASGLGYEITPFAAEQGAAIDQVAIKYGVPEDAISRSQGRSETVSRLQLVFNSLPEDQKGIWLEGLYKDLQNATLITDWQAALVTQEVATNAEKTWDGLSDWLDRLGVVGTLVSGFGAVFKGTKLLKNANNLMNIERTLAAAGAKHAIVAAEGAKILSKAAAMERVRAAGVIAGELTGVSAAIDLTKLVSMSAAKVLPDSITTAAHDLQVLIRDPVERLIAELQTTVAAKGIRAEEAAMQLEELNTIYSKANNPNIHSVNPFTLSTDGTSITGKVLYKPENATAYLTKETAENALKTLDPDGKLGMKIVPDTTNTGFLVEESVKRDLQTRRIELEAELLTAAEAATKEIKKASKGPAKPLVSTVDRDVPPKSLVSSKPRYKTDELVFEDHVDKAAYQVGSKTTATKSDKEIKDWLVKATGWDDKQIASHAAAVRDHIKSGVDLTRNEDGALVVSSQVPESSPSVWQNSVVVKEQLKDNTNMVVVGNIRVQNIPTGSLKGAITSDIVEFTTRMTKALGMERPIVVLNMDALATSKNPLHKTLYKDMKSKHGDAGAVHYNYEDASVIVMQRSSNRRNFIETYAHEFAHSFEAQFAGKHFESINNAFNAWLDAKGIKWKGHGINKVMDKIPLPFLLEYRSITNAEQLVPLVDKWLGGNTQLLDAITPQLHVWTAKYGEFFAEQFTKWAFTDEVPTTILGQYFSKLVNGFKQIATSVTEMLVSKGILNVNIESADKNIAKLLNTHVKLAKDAIPETSKTLAMVASESKSMKRSIDTIQKELQDVQDEMAAIGAAETGLKTGWLIEKPVERKLDYSIIGKYSDEDINSLSRYALGDWALSTSSELYSQRVVGINQQSRYTKLLTNFVRPSVEKLSKAEMVMLNDILVVGDKEGKVFSTVELAGFGVTNNARTAYYKVRALRDVMHQMRNDVASKSLIRKGYVKLTSAMKLDDGGYSLFVKPISTPLNKTVYVAGEGRSARVTDKFAEEANMQGLQFFETTEPVMIDGKYRKTFAFKQDDFNLAKIEDAIPYRAGEYRRIYSDEYFVKIKSEYEIDGVVQEVVQTHRTASSAGDANAYIKAFNEAGNLAKAGKLSTEGAAKLLQPFGWKPEEVLDLFNSGRLGDNYKVELRYNRTDDDYISESIGLSSNFSSKRGDRVLSVHGESTVNTVSPLDSIAAEIGNTTYVASATEWRESHIQRWFNTFADDLPANVRNMSAEDAFRYTLNNEGAYVGQSKRLLFAQRVQEYIMSQMNIPTKEERAFLGFMRTVSESIEGATSNNKAVATVGMALRTTRNYPQWARTIAFHSFFAFNPVQFFMQGMNAFNAIAISPIHGLAAAKSSAMYGLALMSDQESIWRNVAKANKLSNLGLGMSEDDFVEVVRSIRRSGLLDGINSNSLYGAETGSYGIFNGLSRKVGTAAATPFNTGEALSRLVSYDIARREHMAANPGAAWWSDDAIAKIIERQDDLTQNMTKANVATWQQGWKSIPAQFVQYQVKLMMNVVQSVLGNSRVFTRGEALQLLLMHTAVMGTAGAFLWPFRDLVTSIIPEDATDVERLTIQQGVVSGMIAAITDGEAKLALGSRFNTFRYYEDVAKGLFDPEKNFLEVLAGPSGFASLRLLGGVGEALSIVVKAPMTPTTLQIALIELGKGSFSTINNITKARIAMANYNQVMSGSGKAMFRVTDTEAWMIGMGIPPATQEDLSIMYTSKKAYGDEMKAAAKDVGKHAMLALTALRSGDTEGHKTHWAVVQAYLNTYEGDDLRTLMKEAYKVEAFTQYEKMVVEQMVKQYQITDLTTQGQ
jgi:hypothetical protein